MIVGGSRRRVKVVLTLVVNLSLFGACSWRSYGKATATHADLLVAMARKGADLVASGRLSEILAFGVRGWELVVADVRDDVIAKHQARVTRALPIGAGRFALELPLDTPPEQLLADLVAEGGKLVSLNPVRDTLEDFFVEKVGQRAGSAV